MTIEIIAAVSENGAIGKDNKLLWDIPADLKRFREITTGNTVIMGRKTWESLPQSVRPLKNRRNVVLTRTPGYIATGAEIYSDIGDIPFSEGEKLFIIGGSHVYAEFVQYADVMHITYVGGNYDADSFFPDIDPLEWDVDVGQPNTHEGKTFSFVTMKRVKFS